MRHTQDETTFCAPFGIMSLAMDEKMFNLQPTINPSNWLGPIWIMSTTLCFRGSWLRVSRGGSGSVRKDAAASGSGPGRYGHAARVLRSRSRAPIMNPGFLNWNMLAVTMADECRRSDRRKHTEDPHDNLRATRHLRGDRRRPGAFSIPSSPVRAERLCWRAWSILATVQSSWMRMPPQRRNRPWAASSRPGPMPEGARPCFRPIVSRSTGSSSACRISVTRRGSCRLSTWRSSTCRARSRL